MYPNEQHTQGRSGHLREPRTLRDVHPNTPLPADIQLTTGLLLRSTRETTVLQLQFTERRNSAYPGGMHRSRVPDFLARHAAPMGR